MDFNFGENGNEIFTSSYCVVLRRYNDSIPFERGGSRWTR